MILAQRRQPGMQQLLLVALFATSVLAAQLSTLQHAVDHHFHKHSVLCDFFLDFEHNTSPLQPSIAVAVVIPVDSATYFTITNPVHHGVVGVSRIRGPPSLLV